MNKERLLEIADLLETLKYRQDGLGFTMSYEYVTRKDGDFFDEISLHHAQKDKTECGAAGCIMGWAYHHAEKIAAIDLSPYIKKSSNRNEPFVNYEEFSSDYFDLDWEIAETLFYPNDVSDYNYYTANNEQVARVIRNLVNTGEVDWSILDGEVELIDDRV